MSDPLETALAALTEKQRAAFLARAEGYSWQEVGNLLGVKRETARDYHRNAELRLLRAFRPIMLQALRSGSVDAADLDLSTPQDRPKGVYWHRGIHKWVASIRVDGRRVHLGTFATMQEASDAVAEVAA